MSTVFYRRGASKQEYRREVDSVNRLCRRLAGSRANAPPLRPRFGH